MARVEHWTETFVIKGTGTSVVAVECYPSPASGVLNAIPSIRATGLLTALANVWFVRNVGESLVVGTPKDDYVVAEVSAVSITPSETDRSDSTSISKPPFFNKGLGIIVSATASSTTPWEVFITIEFAELDGVSLT